jgi:hypothetical protein
MVKRPNVPENEMERMEKKFDNFQEEIKELTEDTFTPRPVEESENQTKMSQKDMKKSKNIYLKPFKSIGDRNKFNEKFRDAYNHAKEYVCFIAENKEVIGESIEMWTKPFPGIPAELWHVPVNKPIWGPRYVAEQISRKQYSRLVMKERQYHDGQGDVLTHSMVSEMKVPRLDAYPASPDRVSVFTGASRF